MSWMISTTHTMSRYIRQQQALGQTTPTYTMSRSIRQQHALGRTTLTHTMSRFYLAAANARANDAGARDDEQLGRSAWPRVEVPPRVASSATLHIHTEACGRLDRCLGYDIAIDARRGLTS